MRKTTVREVTARQTPALWGTRSKVSFLKLCFGKGQTQVRRSTSFWICTPHLPQHPVNLRVLTREELISKARLMPIITLPREGRTVFMFFHGS